MHWDGTNTAYTFINGAFNRTSLRGETADDLCAKLLFERTRASVEAQRRWNA